MKFTIKLEWGICHRMGGPHQGHHRIWGDDDTDIRPRGGRGVQRGCPKKVNQNRVPTQGANQGVDNTNGDRIWGQRKSHQHLKKRVLPHCKKDKWGGCEYGFILPPILNDTHGQNPIHSALNDIPKPGAPPEKISLTGPMPPSKTGPKSPNLQRSDPLQ